MDAPPVALATRIETSTRWRGLRHEAQVVSTNDLAAQSLRGDEPGLVFTADQQTGGRGRRGRVWEDRPRGASLAMSVTLAAPTTPTLVPLATGIAVSDTIDAVGVPTGLKWPNDVLAVTADGGRKLCGILVERHGDGIVVGIGLNVDLRRGPSIDGATSVAQELGRDVDRWALVGSLLDHLDARIGLLDDGRDDDLLGSYRRRCKTIGQEVIVSAGALELEGRAVDVGPVGQLVVEDWSGRRREVSAGDVHHVRPR